MYVTLEKVICSGVGVWNTCVSKKSCELKGPISEHLFRCQRFCYYGDRNTDPALIRFNLTNTDPDPAAIEVLPVDLSHGVWGVLLALDLDNGIIFLITMILLMILDVADLTSMNPYCPFRLMFLSSPKPWMRWSLLITSSSDQGLVDPY